MPIAVPMVFWNESFFVSFMVPFLLRTVLVLNFTWMVNSWAHAFGTRPYDKYVFLETPGDPVADAETCFSSR